MFWSEEGGRKRECNTKKLFEKKEVQPTTSTAQRQ